VAVVGQAFDDAAKRLPTVSLAERFGLDESMADAGGCLFECSTELLGLLGSLPG
jgi:hypothetical protein